MTDEQMEAVHHAYLELKGLEEAVFVHGDVHVHDWSGAFETIEELEKEFPELTKTNNDDE